ncbi:DUF7537 family lipoprotein [Haloarchaeobius amylolyticus]|uniref:DUF7537 family lipoprotein n=1 Tax=Haloarchaeobius amylolyticus TaxID=1198296 RepID=UPI0022702486|nr:hypothetical protein [Haloarchaeobius amylolyticus]
MRARHVLVLAIALVLAGCGSLGPVTETREPFAVDGTDRPTVTDGPTTTRPPQFDPDPTENDLGDVRDMLSAQGRVLQNTSYRADYLVRATHENGTVLLYRHVDGAYAANDSRYLVAAETSGTTVPRRTDFVLFGDGTRAFVRQTTENGTSVSVPRQADGGDPIPPTDLGVFRGRDAMSSFLYQGFAGMNVTSVTELDRVPPGLDEPLYRVQSGSVESPQLLAQGPNGTVENASFEAIVDHRGFVYEYRLTFETETDAGDPVRIERRLVYRDLGNTTVPRPDWVEDYEAENGTTTTARVLAQA